MTQFFEKRDRWGHGLGIWVLAGMVFILPVCWHYLKDVHLENDVQSWLPEDNEQRVALDWYDSQFDVEDTVIITWAGSTIHDPRIALLQHALEPKFDAEGVPHEGSPYFKKIATPLEALERMAERKIDQKEAIRRLTGILIGRGPLRVRLTDEGRQRREQTIVELEQLAHRELGLELKISDAHYEAEPELTDEQFELLEKIGAEKEASRAASEDPPAEIAIEFPEHDFQVSWRGIDHMPKTVKQLKALAQGMRSPPSPNLPQGEPVIEKCFFAPGSPVAVIATVSEEGEADKKQLVAALRAAAADAGIPADELYMGGRAIANTALNSEVVKAAWNPSYPLWQFNHRSPMLLSGLVSVLLAFVMLRSVRLTLMVLAVSYYTIYVTVSLVPATGGSMNMVLIVMPTLLLVLTISGAIHVANYWKHANARNPHTSVVESVKMAAKPCSMASITTAIGLLSLNTSSLTPVKDFGIYSAVGCLISLGVVLYGLPSLLQLWPAPSESEEKLNARPWQTLGRMLSRHWIPVTAVFLIASAASMAGLKYFRTETKVIRYFPDKSRIVQDYREIEENLTGIVGFDTIVRFDHKSQGTSATHDANSPELSFLERMEVVRKIEESIRKHREVSGTISLADFMPATESPGPDATPFQIRNYNIRSMKVQEAVTSGDAKESSRRFISPPVPEGEKPTVRSENQFALSAPEDELWRITAQVSLMSDADYGELTAEFNEIVATELKMHPGTSHVITGTAPIFIATQQAVLDSLIVSFGCAFVVIAVVMVIVLKDLVSGLLTMIPNILPVGVVFGLISWGGLAVDIGTMITASVALGIAIDGTLHLLTWFREGIREGRTRREAIAVALGHCGPAMWQTSMAIGMGMLMLYWADLLLVSRFGWLMAALIAAALLGDVILLPAMLSGLLGGLIERRVQAEQTKEAPATAGMGKPVIPEPHVPSFTNSPREKTTRRDRGSRRR